MKHYLNDRGIQASAATGVIIATLAAFFADSNPLVWGALGMAWAIATAAAIWVAHGKAVG